MIERPDCDEPSGAADETATEKLRAFVQGWLNESPANGLHFTYPDAEALAQALKAA